MSRATPTTLLERLREGADPLAWDDFFRRYWRVIYAFARRRGCSDHTAEEIVQEVMLAVFRQRDIFFRYDPARGSFRDWLATVVRNEVVTYRRRPAQRLRAFGGDCGAAVPEPGADQGPPDQSVQLTFERALLAVLLDVVRREVDPRDYLAFELLTLHELSGHEAARLTGLSRNAAYKARRRIVKRLRELGAGYAEEGRLDTEIRQALRDGPSPMLRRSLTARAQRTLPPR